MIRFTKAHAYGNDFLIVDELRADRQHALLAKRLCDRTTGVGADGVEFLDRSHRAGIPFLRLFNADGSEAELSGNGTRCVAAYLAHTEGLKEVTFGTHGGPRQCQVLDREGSSYRIETGMGVPKVMPRSLSMVELLPDGSSVVEGAMVNVGNPHFVLFVDTEDFSAHGMAWQEMGARLSTDARFPHGTNVEFVRIVSGHEIAFRIFERGCGPTSSSGTGTCASAAAAIAIRGAECVLMAAAEGGTQQVAWSSAEAEMRLVGDAELLCEGVVLSSRLGSATRAEEPLRDLGL